LAGTTRSYSGQAGGQQPGIMGKERAYEPARGLGKPTSLNRRHVVLMPGPAEIAGYCVFPVPQAALSGVDAQTRMGTVIAAGMVRPKGWLRHVGGTARRDGYGSGTTPTSFHMAPILFQVCDLGHAPSALEPEALTGVVEQPRPQLSKKAMECRFRVVSVLRLIGSCGEMRPVGRVSFGDGRDSNLQAASRNRTCLCRAGDPQKCSTSINVSGPILTDDIAFSGARSNRSLR